LENGRIVLVHLAPVILQNDFLGTVSIFRDITHEVEVDRLKSEFVATVSHELRTPMTSILGWVQFLRTGAFEQDELEEALQTIESSARLQARLIDDMLDVSRIVLGKFQVDLRPTKMSEVVEAALATARPVAAEREVKLTVEIESADDSVVQADASRMQQVIGNILSNAIKFTPPGKRVDLHLDRVDHKLRIRVTDQGEGIEPGFLPYVFERLRQADGPGQRSGLGLGLAIARHIVDLHHGEITAASEGPGRGATFTVTLPVPTEQQEEKRPAMLNA
jgi:signal transduction histidine kinase